jgi:hypothetical protein
MEARDLRDAEPGTPRWVKVFGIVALVVVLMLVLVLFLRGTGGGPALSGSFGSQESLEAGER